MPKYSHQLALAFTVISDHPEGEDITPEMIRSALSRRLVDLSVHDEWQEACLPPIDSDAVED